MKSTTLTSKFSAIALIEDMANYVTTGNVSSQLASAEAAAGKLALRGICIALLSWLKSRSRLKNMVKMKISEVGSDANILINLITHDDFFSTGFMLGDGNVVELHSNLSEYEIVEMISTSAKLYNPPRFATKRR